MRSLVRDGALPGLSSNWPTAGGSILTKNCVAALSINPELPSFPETKSIAEFGGSPWITFTQWLGMEAIQEYQKSFFQMRHLVSTDWVRLDRLTTYYLNRDWLHFDEAISAIMPPEAVDFSEESIRDDRLHRLYELFFAAMLTLYSPGATVLK